MPTELIFIICAGVIIALYICGLYLIYQKRIKRLKKQNEDLKKRWQLYQEQIQNQEKDIATIRNILNVQDQHMRDNNTVIASQESRKKELNGDIAAQVENIEKLKTSFEATEEEFKKKYMAERKVWLDERNQEYIDMQSDFVEQFREENRKKMTAAQQLTDKLDELRSAANAAVEVAKRHAEEENFNSFHSLQMGQKALADIKRLEDIVPNVSAEAGEAIAKVIWKVYYEKPTGDMVGRVIGNRRATGIYRITNTADTRCYVGQAVDIGDRWKQHIKRALNAEPRTQNKLYPAMYENGIQNFTFEIIEECDQSKLNEREDYWQDFYHAKEYGYSIK